MSRSRTTAFLEVAGEGRWEGGFRPFRCSETSRSRSRSKEAPALAELTTLQANSGDADRNNNLQLN
jgi:hypothetical protein